MYHASKSASVTKKTFHTGQCKWKTAYSGKTVIVPSKANVNVWKREDL
ncbi:hypothetical protein [Streptomyces omiyaensis]